jgi:Dockerin type I domain
VSGRVVTVNLTGVSNAQTIGITLSNVSDGTNTNDVSVSMGVLLGDTNKSGSVTSSDVTLTQSKSGQTANSTNFREDVTLDGVINSTDVQTVQSKVGTKLP